jgi:rubrerythrin
VSRAWSCETCGTQFEPSATTPARCPIVGDGKAAVEASFARYVAAIGG